MELTFHLASDGKTIVDTTITSDQAIKMLALLILSDAAPIQNKKVQTKKTAKVSVNEGDLRPAGARRHPMTADIERMLIEGSDVAEISEQCLVSKPTIYVIKARLKHEGKL